MKKILHKILITLVFGVFIVPNAIASHAIGADISYECLNQATRTYLVTVKFYRDCYGIAAPGSMSITPSSSCGNGTSFTLNQIPGSPTVIDPTCGGTSSCSGGPDKGIEEYVYQGITTLPFDCNDWTFAWSTCCRNSAIDNLNNPGSQDFYVKATLNSIDAPCNTAPVFTNLPVPFTCNGQSYTFNNGVFEPDGDSLVYILASPMQNASTTVNFAVPYTTSDPLPTISPVAVDPVTGDITFTPNAAPFDGVFALIIEEYRNGTLIGSVVRDIQITILNCTNTLPVLSGVDSSSVYDTTIIACQSTCFNIYTNDPDGNNLMLQASFPGIFGATFTVTGQGTPGPVGTFCLSPVDNDTTSVTPLLLTVTVTDDACPIIGQQTFSYAIYVDPGTPAPTITATKDSICTGECVTLTATAADSYLWNTGETSNQINVCPTTTSQYTLLATTGNCIRTVFYTIYVNSSPLASVNPNAPVLCNGASVSLMATGGVSYLWSTGEATGTIIVSPLSDTIYWVEVSNTDGCKDTAYAIVTMNPPPLSAACNVIYVIPGTGPFGTGTSLDPADLITGLSLARCNNSTIKMRQGTYNISNSISITNNTTLEGGYDPANWDIKSNSVPTIIYRDNTNPETSPLRITAIDLNTVSNFRLQDITIRVADALQGTGMSVYGIHLVSCTDYEIVRCSIYPGDAGSGIPGNNGTAGTDGGKGGSGLQGDPNNENISRTGGTGGSSPCGCTGGVGGSNSWKDFYAGGAQAGACGGGTNGGNSDGNPGSDGTGTGYGGGAGGDFCSSGCSHPGSSNGGNGGNGSIGSLGTTGTVGSTGSHSAGYWQNGSQGGTGGTGGCGTGGGGGGGGGAEAGFFCDDGAGNSGSGGGGGGEGGTGGTGGFGGGGSFGIYLFSNGANSYITDTEIIPGTSGTGGNTGPGGTGGNGGDGGDLASGNCDVGQGGQGGNGGDGGTGGNGGAGQNGVALDLYEDISGIAAIKTNVNDLSEPGISVSNKGCSDRSVIFSTTVPGTTFDWDFGSGANPQFASGTTVITQFNVVDYHTITLLIDSTPSPFIYTDFTGILITAAVSNPTILSSDTNVLCPGDSLLLLSSIQAANFDWNIYDSLFNLLQAYNGSSYSNISNTFNDPGTYYITLMTTSDCCGNSFPDTLQVFVDTFPVADITGINGLCNGECGILYASGGDSYLWSNGWVTDSMFICPAGDTTVSLIAFNSNGCPGAPDVHTITIAPQNQVYLYSDDTLDICASDTTPLQLNALSLSPNPGIIYYWSDNFGMNDTTILPTLMISTDTTTIYFVQANDNGCISPPDSILVTVSDLEASIFSSTNISCYGDYNGSATVAPSGGWAPFTYLWSSSSTDTLPAVTGLMAGVYNVTITDSIGCTSTDTIIITQADSLVLETGALAATCDSSDGELIVFVNGGTPSYSYEWFDNLGNPLGQNDSLIDSLAPGVYWVTVTDIKGCYDSAFAIVDAPGGFNTIISSITNIYCYGDSNGSATVIIDSSGGYTGTSPINYLWNTIPPQTDSIANNLSAGNYTVEITDSLNCKTSALVTINQPDSLIISISKNDVNCFGDSNGTANMIVTGGIIPYDYLWSPGGQLTDSIVELIPGTYSILITDSNGCFAIDSILIIEPTVLTDSISKTDITCNGLNNGMAIVNASGGTIPYTYLWSSSSADTFPAVTGLIAGVYAVTITDSNGCISTDSIIITQPDSLILATNVLAATCDSSDGEVIVFVNGGTPSYIYEWFDSFGNPLGQYDSLVDSLAPGTYWITVTDTLGCSDSASAIVDAPGGFNTIITNITYINCYGDSNGSATVIIDSSGSYTGTPPINYLWNTSPPQNDSTANNLSAGNYTVEITDSLNCKASVLITINQPDSLIISILKTDVSCFGDSNGTADMIVTGGTIPYDYLWSPDGQLTDSIGGLTLGTYSVVVTDTNGCTTGDSILITEPTSLTDSISKTDVTCNGLNNGAAIVNTSGGTIPYTWLWSSSSADTLPTVTGLIAGFYTVTITDSNGCTSTESIIITQPDSLVLTTSALAATCDSSDGELIIFVNGGTPSYSYEWFDNFGNSLGQYDSLIDSLAPGVYWITVTDIEDCSDSTFVIVDAPAGFNTIITNITYIKCYGDSNGSATVIIDSSGSYSGTPPINYLWNTSPIQTDSIANNLSAGTYSVEITDSLNCKTSVVITINQPDSLIISILKTDLSCFGDSSGTADMIVTGGTIPYNYLWSPDGQLTDSIGELIPGTYSVLITDTNGCFAVDSVLITEPTKLTDSISKTDITCNGLNNGAAIVNTSGGTIPYTWLWSSSSADTLPVITGLIAGVYTVSITDSNGCTTTDSIIITQPDSLVLATSVLAATCDSSDGELIVFVNGGTPSYSYEWFDNFGNSLGEYDSIVDSIGSGVYLIKVTDIEGCSDSAFAIVDAPVGFNSIITNITHVSCYGDSNGSATVIVDSSGSYPGTPPINFLWNTSPPQTNSIANNLSAGTYSVEITDSLNCKTSAVITINQPDSLIISILKTDVSCFGDSNGTADMIVTGGTIPYNYLWSPDGQLTDSIGELLPGTYSILITDTNGCFAVDSVLITEPTVLTDSISKTDVTCNGLNNGVAFVNTSGGTTPYTWLWSSSSTDTLPTVTGLIAGVYTVTITDNKGCTSNDSIIITQPDSLVLATSALAATCDSSDGKVIVFVNGGTPSYSYEWFDNFGNSLGQYDSLVDSLAPGMYWVTVTDSLNCSDSALAIVDAPESFNAIITGITHVNCYGGSNGSATVIIDPSGSYSGTPPIDYLWNTSPPQIDSTAINLSAGNYTVEITDSLNCKTFVLITINQPDTLIINISKTDVNCFGDSNGTANIIVSGGAIPYDYLWSPDGQLTDSIPGLKFGTYTVLVTDSNGCTASDSVLITEPTALTDSISKTDVTCNGLNNGVAIVNASNGITPYTYLWSDGQTNDTAIDLSQGTYYINVTDSTGCTIIDSMIIIEPLPLSLDTNSTDEKCFNASGKAIVITTGGTSPYTYLWSNGDTTATTKGLSQGTYSVLVIDANLCEDFVFITINRVQSTLSFTTDSIDEICNNASGQAIIDSVSGGTSPYSYLWSNGDTTSTATGLSQGTYSVLVTDADLCEDSVFVMINRVQYTLSFTTDSIDEICNNASGQAIIDSISGGTSPYSYLWSNGDTVSTATGLSQGTYSVIVTDINLCKNSVFVTVNRVQFPLTLNTSIIPEICGDGNGSATVFVNGGSRPYTYLWNTSPEQYDSTAIALDSGIYTVIVTDINKCKDSVLVTIKDSSICEACTLKIYNSISPNNDGVNDTWIINGIGVPGAPNVILACTRNKYKVTIYNRWGDKVWEGADYDNSKEGVVWDGNNKSDKPLPDGTYYYVIEIDNPTGQQIFITQKKETYEFNSKVKGINGWVHVLR